MVQLLKDTERVQDGLMIFMVIVLSLDFSPRIFSSALLTISVADGCDSASQEAGRKDKSAAMRKIVFMVT
jgi:hypothetical protein